LNLGMKNRKKIIKEEFNISDLLSIEDIKKGILVTQNSYTLMLEVLPINFKLKSRREQNFIIGKYEELHKAFKTPFDTRTISRKEDSREHLDYINRLAETEENENVQALISEYESFVSDMAYKSAVKKRFIVYIPYVVPPGFKFESIHREDAERWLLEKGTQFIEYINQCGNEVVIPKNQDQFAAQILFELINIKSAEKESVPNI